MIPFQSFGNTLRWKFENISTLSNKERFSDVFSIGPTEWKIAISFRASQLSIELQYDSGNNNEKTWLCETEAIFKLLRQSGTGRNTEKTRPIIFHGSYISGGYPAFETLDNFYSADVRVNNSIIVEINLNLIYHDFSKKVENFTDIIINVEDTEFHLNKWVLCSKSKYFYDLFVTQKSTESVIKLNNIAAKSFCYLLIPFNPNFITVREDTYRNLIKIAKDFGVRSLYQSCEQYLLTKNDTLKIIIKLKLADENDFELLMKKSIESIKSIEELKNVMKEASFLDLKDVTKCRIMMRLLDFV